jgi:hypothetical protein
MSSERPEEFREASVNGGRARSEAAADDDQPRDATDTQAPADDAKRPPATPATVLVRGETVRDQASTAPPKDETRPRRKEVSAAKAKLQKRLPALDDDSDVGVQKAHRVVRDAKADLAFTGALLASAAPYSAPEGQWREYRIYETNGGKHVFSKMTRTVYAQDNDVSEAEVFDPSPSSVPSQLLRSARDLARSRPMTWRDAAVAFFGYDPLAKDLYRKLDGQFEEHVD